MKRPTLTVCVSSMHTRTLQLAECLAALRPHRSYADRIEIIVDISGTNIELGRKRNALNAQAHGDYIAHVDDDDIISPRYYFSILRAIDEWYDESAGLRRSLLDAVLIRGRRTEQGAPTNIVEFDYRLGGTEGEWISSDKGVPTIWRSPGHVCAIRSAWCKLVQYPDSTGGEDLEWSAKLAPYLKTAARAGKPDEILYEYRWRSSKEFGT